MMKIVFFITALDYSGGPKMMAWVANKFAKAGHKVTFLSIYSDKAEQVLNKKIEFVSVGMKKSKNRMVRNSVEMLRVQNRVKKTVDMINPDLVVGFLYSVDYFFTLFNRKYKVMLSQRLDPYNEKGLSAKMKEYIIGRASGVVFQSDGARDYYNSKVRIKSCVIPNPVTQRTLSYQGDVKCFEQRKDIIVLPGRLDILQKRQDVMISAFEIVNKEFPNVELTLLGNGPDRARLQELINNKNLTEVVTIHEATKTAEEYTKDCKIACLTSDFEGLPNSLIESMALGLNVVSTDCSPGGARMLINDGINGYIVPCGDYELLAKRIITILKNPVEAQKMSEEAKKIANQFSEDNIAKMWIDYASKIVNEM